MNNAKKSSLNQTYRQFMETGFKSEGLSSLQKIVVKEVAGFGSAIDEKIKGINGLKTLLQNQKIQTKGMKLTWTTKPFSRYVSEDENTAVFAGDVYLNIKSGKELIKMYLRFSVVLNYINNQWKVIHWHGSKPEQVQSEADTYGIDNLKQKNAELEKLVEEKTADLTQKNRELEVEAALERVRSRAMAMYTSDELKEVAKEMRNQLHLLGQKELETCAIHLWDKSPGEFEAWAALRSPNNKGKIIESETKFKIKGIKILEENFQHYRSGKKDYVLVNDVAKARQFFEALKTVDPNAYAFLSPTIKNKKSQDISAYWAVADFAGGSLVMVTMNPPEENSRALLRRFADVFGLAFRRFSDLQKAEAQAREAEIELGLERVRSRAMAMQSSDELKALIGTLFTELTRLDLALTRCIIWVFDPATNDAMWWMANVEDPSNPMSFFINYHQHPAYLTFIKAWKNQNIRFIYDLKGKDKVKWDNILFNETELKNLPEAVKNGMRAPERVLLSASFNNFGGINVASLEPLSDEHFDILLRFAKVFDLTYTRFLDLQKAEAQTREAQIQLALERVRARTMAMQDSKELSDTSFLLANQVRELGINAWGCAFHIYADNEEGDYEWFSNEDGYLPFYKTPRKKYFKQYFENRHCEQGIFIKEFKGKDCATHYDFLMQIPVVGDALRGLIKSGIALPTSQIDHIIYFEYGYLLFITYKPVPEAHHIFKRFTKEFEQTYIRFLDLQKAEAQAREAQIQLALERVRAKTMAMQKSDELGEAAVLLFKQIKQLGIETYASGFNIWDKEAKNLVSWMSNPTGEINPPFEMPIESFERHRKIYAAWKKNETYYEEDIKDDALVKHYKFLRSFPLLDKAFKKSEAAGIATPDRQVHNVAFFKQGFLLFITLEPHPEWKDIFIRCATVFEQTYTRFNDLKQAEAQAREAQIETALERIRSMVTAMHESNELLDIVVKMRTEFVALGHDAHYFWHMKWTSEKYLKAMTSGDGSRIGMVMELPRKIHSQIKQIADWEKSKEPAVVFVMNVKETLDYVRKMVSWGDFERVDPNMPSEEDIHHIGGLTFIMARTQHGEIGYSLPGMVPHPPQDAVNTLIRFAAVFDLAYRRFEDLKTAEKQNRETQVELALEKVRSRSMGMQKSEELREVIRIVYEQLIQLNIHVEHAGFLIDYKKGDNLHIWLADEHLAPSEVIFPWFDCPPNNAIWEAKEKGEDFFFYHLNFEEKNKFYQDLFKLIPSIPDDTIEYYLNCPGLAGSGVLLESIGLYIENFSGTVYTEEENAVLMRFGKVFQQTYTRFLDLQKAEAQAREAQIEAALERVRSRTMAMQKSEELANVATVLFQQVKALGVPQWACGFCIWDIGDTECMWYPGSADGEILTPCRFPLTGHQVFKTMDESRKRGDELYILEKEGELQADHYQYMMTLPGVRQLLQDMLDAGHTIPTFQIDHYANFAYGNLIFITYEHFPEMHDIFKRFAKVFEQTYTRFLDLQKAEMQAREAKIEVSLEKVRTVALILKKSDEMLDVVQALYEALYELGFTNIRNSIIDVHNPQNETFLDYDYSPQLGRSITEMSYYDSPFIENQVRKTESDNGAFFELILEGQELQDLINMRLKNGEAEDPRLRQTKQLTYNLYSFGNGAIGISNFGLLSDEQKEILKRFRNVFAFAYKRYSDMVQAEAQAREAQIEASLEKVRSRTLAMQKSDELAETAAVLFQQLITLGIAPNRLFIIIMKTDSSELEAWVTDEDGSKVSIGFTTNYQNNPSIKKMYQGWQQQKKSLVIDMQGEELQQYFHYLHDELKVPFKGGLEQKRRIQHLAYFSHGLIGMASPEEQPAETIPLLERFAAVFNLTFTRFNDLKMAEAHALQAEQDLIAIKEAKQKAEVALTELQSTQKQLIQSEKMASLGELTAGIAHEIQNPLNFVNNFSEVSNELIEELRMRNDALRIDDTEIKNLLSDIGQNLEKINHHGQRAADIVKGMLQHSRSNTGQKEWTDINTLCDEYLRLAYHGLRAKDKTFNAKFETDFDSSLQKILIVPQEIGRVVLNMINNAFYACTERSRSAATEQSQNTVSEKNKHNVPDYEPTVIVSTKMKNGKAVISITDNGNGIPQNILEKIFQPFFTTKPTGSGTGLGLSLSYDIVKAHKGEIKVESTQGKGTIFNIELPAKDA